MTNDDDSFYDVVGYIGALFLSISFVPQTYSLMKSGNYEQIRYVFLYNTIMTSICMATYGIHHKRYPIVIGNASVLANATIILYNKSTASRVANCQLELPQYSPANKVVNK